MAYRQGVRVAKWPIGQEYCYLSCYFRKGDRCCFRSKRGRQIAELKKKRNEIRDKIDEIYKPNEERSEHANKLYEELYEIEDELKAYINAKVVKIAENADAHPIVFLPSQAGKEIKLLVGPEWYRAVDWKQPDNRKVFDILPEATKNLIVDAGLCPECVGLDYSKAPEDTPWDYNESDYTIDQLKKACAIVLPASGKEGELLKSDCKLPHHLPNGTLVWSGVAAAGAALMGARGGVKLSSENASKAKSHLEKHYGEFDKTAPWKQKEKDVVPDSKALTEEAERLLRRPDLIEA